MAADGAQEVRAHAMGAEMQGTTVDGGPGARDGTKMQGVQRGGTWAHLRGVDVGETRGMAMCAPRGLGCMWHVYEGCGQHPVSHGLGMDALGNACLHADSDFIDVSDSIHNLCKPHLGGLLCPEVHLGVRLGEHARQADEVSRGECNHALWWPCCAVMFCAHGQGGDTAREGHRCT